MSRVAVVIPAVLLAFGAPSLAAQTAQVMVGHPLPPRTQNPPTLPFRHVIERPSQLPGTTPRPQRGNVVYVPAALPYYTYALSQPQPAVSVNVTNVVETPAPSVTLYNYISPPERTAPLGNGWRVWDPDADIAAERAARTAVAAKDDVYSLDAIIAAYYDVHSGPRGTPRNWERFRSLLSDGARLIATRTDSPTVARATVLSADDYAAAAAPVLEQGVFQKEVSRTVDRFGAIAHVFSTYEVRRMSGDDKPFQRGINSMQLVNDGTRWWIMSVSWDAERADNPIPAKYLPAPKPAAPRLPAR